MEKKRFRSEKNLMMFVEKQRARDIGRGNMAWSVRMPVEIRRYRETERTKIVRVFVEEQRAKSEGNLSVLYRNRELGTGRESAEKQRYGI